MFLKQQISLLESFLKDHMTLKSNDAAIAGIHYDSILILLYTITVFTVLFYHFYLLKKSYQAQTFEL